MLILERAFSPNGSSDCFHLHPLNTWAEMPKGNDSSIQGWYAGDVLSTGTPRAFHIQDGDIAECRIVGPDGFEMEPLKNPVVDLKLH